MKSRKLVSAVCGVSLFFLAGCAAQQMTQADRDLMNQAIESSKAASASAQKAESAATRAEAATDRSEASAKRAEAAAVKAEQSAMKAQKAFETGLKK